MMRLHLHNSKNITCFTFLPQNLEPTIYCSVLFIRTEKSIKQIAKRNLHSKYENNNSAPEIPKPDVVRSWKNIPEGKSCKLMLFLTHWPLSDPAIARALIWWFDLGWLSSALTMFSKHHKQLHQIRRTDSECPRLSQKYVIKKSTR